MFCCVYVYKENNRLRCEEARELITSRKFTLTLVYSQIEFP